MEDYFERDVLIDLQKIEEKPIEEPNVQVEPKRLSYLNRDGGSFRINRI